MNIRVDQQNDSKVAIVESFDILIRNVQDALDLMVSIILGDFFIMKNIWWGYRL
ncbi:hypothetical protein QFZ81_000962 [Paenibacillus sp. V4I9]|nr:hypothetical protein [Paenibacillus sp. V4I9]